MREKSRQHHKVCFSFYTSIQRHLAGWSFKPQTKKRAELCLLLNITTAAANLRIFFALRMYDPLCTLLIVSVSLMTSALSTGLNETNKQKIGSDDACTLTELFLSGKRVRDGPSFF